MSLSSKTIRLKESLDSGLPGPDDFYITEDELDIINIGEGEISLQVLVMSADPYLRGLIKSSGSIKAGMPMTGFLVGKVIASRNQSWNEGDLMGASLPFSTYHVLSEEALRSTITWKLTEYITEAEASLGVGVLGMPGSTAYGGLIDVLRPNKGETIFISAASGTLVLLMNSHLFVNLSNLFSQGPWDHLLG